ncbi:hypothetical protein Ahy_A03g015759 [Arachis hypogaea]|uniref:Replication protein A 70 kDa DNA-binding subunit B/D first OB fold domain-containing protein n=1 Tax=Arachis hypogaea TaxID=3818 RepID=A0A445E188_ARAHY|nr:hypothetical protein Ahy_A03g015759 [Arachis hypogaea]
MAETFDYLLDVNPKKLAWNFNVYVVRISEVPNKYNEKEIGSIEMILQDSKGDRIHASIPKSVVARWKGNIFEFQMYVMSNFIVVGNKTKPKTTNSNWILMFSQRTTVTHINNPSYPLEAFHFRSISDLLNAERLDDTYLFDVIAEVVRKEDPRDLATSTGKETKRMVVVLEDLENNRIECTLFGEMVDQIRPHFEEGSVEPLIVVLQYFKTSRWNGKTTVQNHFYISKIHIERDLKEGAWSAADELKHGSVGVKTIEESLNVAKKVPKKVETSTIERYEYKGCGHTAGTASIRYKVKVIVYDGTGSMTLLLWDRKAIQLCEKRADQIKEEEINIKSANIEQYDQVYTVSKVCDDEDIIEKNLPKESNTNSSVNLIDVVEEVVSSLKYKTPAKRALNGVKSSTTTINENDEE